MGPGLSWDAFGELPGDARTNFERLARGACWRAYARYGRFAAVSQQPGVEFHLAIELPACPLGDPGRHFGWQTKWWDLPQGRAIGTTRRADVADSIEKTEKHLSGLTDFVLWTRRPLTAGDQQWFYGLQTGRTMRLHLWTEVDLDDLLVGDAELLRQAYFGTLILTPQRLADLHELTVQEIRPRWIPEVHQPMPAERQLRRMLAEPDAWGDLTDTGAEVNRFVAAVTAAASGLDPALSAEVGALVATGQTVVELLGQAHTQLRDGRGTALVAEGRPTVPAAPPTDPTVLRRLRVLRHPIAPLLTNLVAYTRDAIALVGRIERYLTAQLIVVTGDAGFGKTQLAATLTAPGRSRPPGILLYGRHLSVRATLDDFAQQVSLGGAPVTSFESLLAAVDAAAARAGCRLPIVIDGLNEAEAAGAWPPLLRRLKVLLQRYPSTVVVCTVRKRFLAEAIPQELRRSVLQLGGFDEDLDAAISRYFAHYKIESAEVELPRGLLNHPLTLKIYCDVANPGRLQPVRAERLPRSLTGMFIAYLQEAARRIAQLSPAMSAHDVIAGLTAIGRELWDTRARDLPEDRAKELLDDRGRRWPESLLAALEREGVVIRQGDAYGAVTVAVVYDLLAGHVVASSMIRTHGARLEQLLALPATTTLFGGSYPDRHPLAADVFSALAGLLPRFGGRQLWQLVDERLRLAALTHATSLEARQLDAATLAALAVNIDTLAGQDDVLGHLHRTHAAPAHPLNAEFLDTVLRSKSVAARDLRWSEWLRTNAGPLLANTRTLTARWRDNPLRPEADRLRARWQMWMLTSTDRTLRDATTAALYWYGRHDADGLFALAAEALTVDDAYVGERMAAVAYGVTTAHQQQDPAFEQPLAAYLDNLVGLLTGTAAEAPTSHAMIRSYVTGTFNFARRYYPTAVPASATTTLVFAAGPVIAPLRAGDAHRDDVADILFMDFERHPVGSLFPDRYNFDEHDPDHRNAEDHLLGVVHTLGWSEALFGDLDRRIRDRPRFEREARTVEQYGTKYGRVGLHVVAGALADGGATVAAPEVDIDPTFPQQPPPSPVRLPLWAQAGPADDAEWIGHGTIEVPDEFITTDNLDGAPGPWILTHAEINTKDIATGRSVFGLINTVTVDAADLDAVLTWMRTAAHPGRDLIDLPSAYYLYAGEVPWHPGFPHLEPGDTVEDAYRTSIWWHAAARAGVLAEQEGGLHVQRLAHHFGWESHHSGENQANAYLPSRLLSDTFDLRAVPAGFDQTEPDGTLATRSYAASPGFAGDLLYVRADLLRRYAAGRALVTFGWGERNTQFVWPQRQPKNVQRLRDHHQDVWRIVKPH